MSLPPEPDLWFGGRLVLHQPPRGAHRAGTDAALLASLLKPLPGETLCDLGASTGAVGLAAAVDEPGCRVVLVERDPELADLARRNAEANGMAGRVDILVADALAPGKARHASGLTPGLADVVLTNPPFFEGQRHRASPDAGKAAAHGFADGGLDAWLRTCADLLKPGGRLGMIHRADALPSCLEALQGRFGAVCVRPVHPQADKPAIRILIDAVKASRAPLVLAPPLVLQGQHGRLTDEAARLHGERG